MSQRRDGWLAFVLIMSAGYIDGYGLFAYGAFLSFMSGNTTLTGYNLGQGKFAAAFPTLVAVVGFLCGATVGTAIARAAGNLSRRVVLVIVAGLETAALFMTGSHTLTSLLGIAVLSVAMGMLNRAVTRVGGHAISLTFVTGTLSRLGTHIAQAVGGSPLEDATDIHDTNARRAAALTGGWASFLLGAVLAGVAAPRLAEWTLGPSIAALIVLAIIAPRSTIEH